MDKKYIVSYSGGKDSTAMILLMLEKNIPIHKIIHIKTGKEFPFVADSVERMKEYIKPFEVEEYSFDLEYWMTKRQRIKGSRKGEYGFGWPTVKNRWCTGVKIAAMNNGIIYGEYDQFKTGLSQPNIAKLLNPHEYRILIGMATNKIKRIGTDPLVSYPLIIWDKNGREALSTCYRHGFTYDGWYDKYGIASCYCCPLQPIDALKMSYKYFPDLWNDIRRLEGLITYNKFKPKIDLDNLQKKFDDELELERILQYNSCFDGRD